MSESIRIVQVRSSVLPSALDFDLVVDLGQGPVSCSVTVEADLGTRRAVANFGFFPGWIDDALAQAIRDSKLEAQVALDVIVEEIERAPLCDVDQARRSAA